MVLASKGGAGATTVATNLAVALATREPQPSRLFGRHNGQLPDANLGPVTQQKSVCLMDLALQFGTVTSFLNIAAAYTICDLVKNIERLDPFLLDGALAKHASGVRVLAEPARPEDASLTQGSEVERILDTLVQAFSFVIIDTPKEWTEATYIALQRAQLILFVLETNIPSLKSTRRALDICERAGVATEKIRLVLNRYNKSKWMGIQAVEKVLGHSVFRTLPNDYSSVIAAIDQGLAILVSALSNP